MPGSLLIGLEDELMVLQADGQLAAHDFEASWAREPTSRRWLLREMHAATLELLTDPFEHPAPLIEQLQRRRAMAHRLAQPQGQRLAAAGLHPQASPWLQPVHSQLSPHYAALQQEFGDVAQGALSFGLHLHVSLPGEAQRVQLYRLLRERLPLFIACTANAPFSEGRDTGLASFRHAWLARYPRMGVPPDFESTAQATQHVQRLRACGSLGQGAGLWYDLRLHHRLPTVELRAIDAQADLRRIEQLASWLLALAWLVAQGRAPTLTQATATVLIEENHWRARRHGAAAKLVDWSRDAESALPELLQAEATLLAPALQALGLRELFERGLLQPEPAAEQRRWQGQGGWAGLLQTLADQTLQACC